MNAISFATKIVAQHTALGNPMDRSRDHEYACVFHRALSEAFSAMDDIETYTEYHREISDGDRFWADEIERAQAEYSKAVGEAAAALQKMPAKWAAILEAELPKVAPQIAAE